MITVLRFKDFQGPVATLERRLLAYKMGRYRHMLNVRWQERNTNKNIRESVHKRQLWTLVNTENYCLLAIFVTRQMIN